MTRHPERDENFYRQIEMAVQHVFEQNPTGAFLVEELARLAFPGAAKIERNHLIWVGNAAKKVAPPLGWTRRVAWRLDGKIVYFNENDRQSTSLYMARFRP